VIFQKRGEERDIDLENEVVSSKHERSLALVLGEVYFTIALPHFNFPSSSIMSYTFLFWCLVTIHLSLLYQALSLSSNTRAHIFY
jgi:hypothetical protein